MTQCMLSVHPQSNNCHTNIHTYTHTHARRKHAHTHTHTHACRHTHTPCSATKVVDFRCCVKLLQTHYLLTADCFNAEAGQQTADAANKHSQGSGSEVCNSIYPYCGGYAAIQTCPGPKSGRIQLLLHADRCIQGGQQTAGMMHQQSQICSSKWEKAVCTAGSRGRLHLGAA